MSVSDIGRRVRQSLATCKMSVPMSVGVLETSLPMWRQPPTVGQRHRSAGEPVADDLPNVGNDVGEGSTDIVTDLPNVVSDVGKAPTDVATVRISHFMPIYPRLILTETSGWAPFGTWLDPNQLDSGRRSQGLA